MRNRNQRMAPWAWAKRPGDGRSLEKLERDRAFWQDFFWYNKGRTSPEALLKIHEEITRTERFIKILGGV